MPPDTTTVPPAIRNAEKIAVIDAMAELLATPDRWCQFNMGSADSKGPHCLLGALEVATGDANANLFRVVRSTMVRCIRGSGIARWNDATTRKHSQVLDLLARTRRHFETEA